MEIEAFDRFFSTNNGQILKILLSSLPQSYQKIFAIYIKFQELHFTVSTAENPNHTWVDLAKKNADPPEDFSHLKDQILPFCNADQKNQLLSFASLLQQLDTMKETMEMMQILQDIMPSEGFENPEDMMDLIKNLL